MTDIIILNAGIIAVLIGLLLPAVQRNGESAGVIAASTQLLDADGSVRTILPYIEQDNLYRAGNIAAGPALTDPFTPMAAWGILGSKVLWFENAPPSTSLQKDLARLLLERSGQRLARRSYTPLEPEHEHLLDREGGLGARLPVRVPGDRESEDRWNTRLNSTFALNKLREAVDAASATLNISPDGRGYYGTPALAHTAGTRIEFAPAFPRHRVASALNEAIEGTYPVTISAEVCNLGAPCPGIGEADFWAFISVTNNDTQLISTIIHPDDAAAVDEHVLAEHAVAADRCSRTDVPVMPDLGAVAAGLVGAVPQLAAPPAPT